MARASRVSEALDDLLIVTGISRVDEDEQQVGGDGQVQTVERGVTGGLPFALEADGGRRARVAGAHGCLTGTARMANRLG